MYFLFVPAWAFLALSIYYGDRVQRHAIAAKMVAKERVNSIHAEINADFQQQLDWLAYAGAVLVFWLVWYIVWWIFCRQLKGEGEK
jgi:hypothetical protein